MTLCPIHKKPLICASCRAAVGGRSTSQKKLDAAKLNLDKANAALNQQKKKEE